MVQENFMLRGTEDRASAPVYGRGWVDALCLLQEQGMSCVWNFKSRKHRLEVFRWLSRED